MGTLGSGLAGLGNVQTAGEPPSGGAGGSGTATDSAAIAKFSAMSGLVETPSALYMADDGDLGGGSVVPLHYPTSARTIAKLRLSAPTGTGTDPPTATLFKNGVATALTVTLPAGAAAGANVVATTPAISFLDGDTFDVKLTQPATTDVGVVFTATLEGTTDAGDNGFLSDIFDRGEADDPAVHNLMTGPLQRMFINLGTTPPPFPPNAQPFFPECGAFLGEFPADTGVGADSKPLWRLQRHFSTFPSVGDSIWHETQYDLFAGGVNTIYGGDRNQHVLIDQFDNRLTFAIHDWQLTRPGLNAPGYTPTYLDNAPVTYQEFQLMDARGGGSSNNWQFNSDGSQFRQVLIPNVVGPGGGPAGPWTFVADAMSMWSRNGGEPLVGSTMFYDAVTVQTFGAVDTNVTQFIVGHAAVLDAKNLGSGQAAGHDETWIRSTLAGPLVKVANYYDNQIQFLVSVLGVAAVFVGGLTSDGTFATTTGNDVNVGGDLHVGTGEITCIGDVTAGGLFFGNGGGVGSLAYVSDVVDFAALSSGTIKLLPFAIPGFFGYTMQVRFVYVSGTGVCTLGPTFVAGNNAGEDNLISTTSQTAANVNACIAAGFPCQGGTGVAASGSVARQLLDLTTIPTVKIATAAAGTGGFTLTGFIITTLTLLPV